MANRLKGITLEIGGDTTELSKSLSAVNKEIKDTQAQLKDVQKLLKMDPTNIDLLKQKQKLLTDQVKQTRDKLDELKKAQETMDASGVDKSSAQYMNLQREIIETENQLKNLEKAARQSNAVLEQVGAVADKVADGAKKVASATAGMSTAAGGALAALGGMAYKAVTNADDLNTLAKQTGFTTNELQKMQIVGDLVDVSMDSITGAAKKLKTQMASNNDLFKELNINVKGVNGEMRDVNSVFWETVERLSHIGNETARDQIAMELFGKSADQLAGIIDDGGAAWRMYAEDAERAGLILSQDVLDSLNETNDKLDVLKATAKATLTQTGAKALEALLPVLNEVVQIIGKILAWIGSLSSEQIRLGITILAIVAAISPIAGIIGSIASAVSALIPLVLSLNAAFLANPMVFIAAAVGAAIVALAVLIVANWDKIKAAWEDLVAKIKEGAQTIADAVKAGFMAAVDVAKAALSGLLNLGKSIANGLIGIVEGAINGVIGMINNLISAINSVASALAGLAGMSYGGISTFSKVKMPRFAKGGVLSSGTALVGEAGPELLTVAQGKATVQPLTATIDNKSLAALGSGGNTYTKVDVQFSGSLAQLAAVLQPAISAETTRRGVSLVR